MEKTKLIAFDLSVLSEDVIAVLLLDTTAEASLFTEIAHANTHRPQILNHILNHPATPKETRAFVEKILKPTETGAPTEVSETDYSSEKARIQFKTQSLLQRIQQMKVGEKIQLAIRGSKDIRSILLRDTNKEVVMTVLENPKMTDTEIELISKQKTTSDDIIRFIGKKREWLKSYAISHALITNPKTPPAISLKLLHRLRLKDLQALEKNKNVTEAVRAGVKKKLSIKRQS